MCKSTRTRVIESDGSRYRTDLMCSETEPHQSHYDETYCQEWHDSQPEPECAVLSSNQISCYFGYYTGMGVPA